MENLTNSLTSSFSLISTNLIGILTDILPIIFGVVGAVIAVKFAVSLFTSLVKKG